MLLVPEAGEVSEIARQAMAFYLSLSNYHNIWKGLGFTEDDLDRGGSSWFLDAMVAWGPETTVDQRVWAHFDADMVARRELPGLGA